MFFLANKLKRAGRSAKSRSNAKFNAMIVTMAKLTFGMKLLTVKIENVTDKISVVGIIVFPPWFRGVLSFWRENTQTYSLEAIFNANLRAKGKTSMSVGNAMR